MTEYRVDLQTDAKTDSRKQILAKVRAEFLNCLANGFFDIKHNIKVDDRIANDGGKIDYLAGDLEFEIKSASLTRKADKDTGSFCYSVKIAVE